MARDWNIKPRSRSCTICGRSFAPGDSCASVLFETVGGLERQDFCPKCLEKRSTAYQPFSVWQGEIPIPNAPSQPKTEPIQHQTAEALLRRLIELDNPDDVGVIYILAVMLERKKQLIERDAHIRPEGGILRIYEQKSTGDSFVILDPQLRLDAISELQQRVLELLS